MRRLILMVSAGCFAFGLISFTTISADAETSSLAREDGFISQGSAVDSDSAELAAVRADVAEEERLPDYSQVVDNETAGRFSASGWEKRSDARGVSAGQLSYGGNYVKSSGSDGTPARFKVRIPTSNDYTVYAWWPAFSDSSQAARFGIGTASGTQWTAVDQSTDGGIWIKLGTYAMKKGERYIRVAAGSSGTGATVADAVAVVRGNVTMPPAGGGAPAASTGEATFSASSLTDPNGRDVVRVSKRWLGIGYRWGTCTTSLMSCTCETKKTYKRFGHDLSLRERAQWRYDNGLKRRVWNKANLRLGDHVFFKENGPGGGFTHVAIYSGNGNVVHGSSYYGKVVESQMKWISGYYGAKRYRLR